MSNKIENPVVLIHKREDHDTYTVVVTSGSQDYHDAVLMETIEPDMTGYAECWGQTGYYMAAEIERLKQALTAAENNLIDAECHVAELDEALKDKESLLNAEPNTLRMAVPGSTGATDLLPPPSAPTALPIVPSISAVRTDGPRLTITLPDSSSKAFWSGSGKTEVFLPETYKLWVSEAIERDCCIAQIDVKVK